MVSKIPDQKKRVLYYAIVLAEHGRGAPPLPVAEMLTNNTVPSIAYWLLQFLNTVRQFTLLTVSHVETDFSWALMQAVLLSFNKENIFSI